MAGVFRVISGLTACPLKFQRSRRDNFHFPQAAGNFAGAVAFGGKLKDQPDYRGCFGVCGQITFLVLQIAVRRVGG